MIDLKKLNEIKIEDLKDVDWAALWENLKKQPDRIIVTVIVTITVVFLLFYFSKRPQKIQALSAEIQTLEEQIKAIEDYEARKEELDTFLNDIPETITADDLRKLLNDFAVKNEVYIDSFSPARRTEEDLYETISFEINVSADEYRNAVLFIRDLENAPFGIRIDSWDGTMITERVPGSTRPGQSQLETKFKLKIRLNVTAVNFKREKNKT